jgi:hypothetical protein
MNPNADLMLRCPFALVLTLAANTRVGLIEPIKGV